MAVPDQKITILLAEYGTLRAEILQRNSALSSGLMVGLPAISGIVPLFAQSIPRAVLAFVFFVVVLIAAYRIILFDILRLARRVRQIEAEVNERANEKLLVWETEQGFERVGLWRRIKYACGQRSIA